MAAEARKGDLLEYSLSTARLKELVNEAGRIGRGGAKVDSEAASSSFSIGGGTGDASGCETGPARDAAAGGSIKGEEAAVTIMCGSDACDMPH